MMKGAFEAARMGPESCAAKVAWKDAYAWPFGNFLGAKRLFTAIVLKRKAFGVPQKGFNMSADSLLQTPLKYKKFV